jgi:hypothetical protein
MDRFVSQSFLAVLSLSASIALAGTESYDYNQGGFTIKTASSGPFLQGGVNF